MKTKIMSALVAVALFAAPLFAQAPAAPVVDPLSKIPELALSDGRILQDATVGGFTAETVVVRHKRGSTVLRYEFLPDEQRAAAEKKRPGGARSFKKGAAAAEMKAAKEREEYAEKRADERKAIEDATSERRLRRGQSEEQVRRVMLREPVRKNLSRGGDGSFDQWVYDAPNGSSYLYFKNGHLVSWEHNERR